MQAESRISHLPLARACRYSRDRVSQGMDDDTFEFAPTVSPEEERGHGYLLRAGELIGEYRVLRPLGVGGMGEVYLVENVHNRKQYALKLLPPELSRDARFVERFRVESRVMSDLDHPHIVRVHHMGESRGRYYLTMDFVAGPKGVPFTLEDLLEDGPGAGSAPRTPAGSARLDERLVCDIAGQMCDALGYAHAYGGGVVHRDLKPANILIQDLDLKPRGGRPWVKIRVSDFGLVKVLGSDYMRTLFDRGVRLTRAAAPQPADARGTSRHTSSLRSILGTYDYMSPEQKSGREVGPRTDIYSFGVILYRMLTGARPEGAYKPPSHFGAKRAWDAIAERCLQPAPGDRYASVAELRRAVERLIPARARTRRTVGAMTGGLLLLAVLGGLAWYGVRFLPRRPRPVTAPPADETVRPPPVLVPAPSVGVAATGPVHVVADDAMPSRPAPADRAGSFRVSSPLPLLVYEGDRLLGRSGEKAISEVAPGEHVLRLSAAGYRDATVRLTMQPDGYAVIVAPEMERVTGFLQVEAKLESPPDGAEASPPGEAELRVSGGMWQRIRLPHLLQGFAGETAVVELRAEGFESSPPVEAAIVQDVTHQVLFTLRAKKGWGRVVCATPSAGVYSGETRLAGAGEFFPLAPFVTNTVVVRAEGHRPQTLHLVLASPGTTNGDVHVDLALHVGRLTVSARLAERYGGGELTNGQFQVGDGPWQEIAGREAVEMLAGLSHVVRFRCPGYRDPPPQEAQVADAGSETVTFVVSPLNSRIRFVSNAPGTQYFRGQERLVEQNGFFALEPFLPHSVIARAPGHHDTNFVIRLDEPGRDYRDLTLTLRAIGAWVRVTASGVPPGWGEITADVLFDREVFRNSRLPFTVWGVPPGRHVVSLRSPQWLPVQPQIVECVNARTSVVTFALVPPLSRIEVNVVPPDAVVTCNGHPLPARAFDLPPGTYVIRAERWGYAPGQAVIQAHPGETARCVLLLMKLDFRMDLIPPAP